MSPSIPSFQLQARERICLIVSQDRGFIAQVQEMIAGKSREVYVATSWREANRLGEEGVIDMVVWDPEMEAGEG
ncbi:MAG: hypothetical protein FJY95_18165 [Candidatus Handelsmanbacteria bacterium]|nr:hypothetical protein [Candidatus Handelsmanbacteria bacterium]